MGKQDSNPSLCKKGVSHPHSNENPTGLEAQTKVSLTKIK